MTERFRLMGRRRGVIVTLAAGLALVGAVVITLARGATGEQEAASDAPHRTVATA